MSLRHPENKMSKSADDINGTIYFDDSRDEIMKKFKSSVTDSEDEIRYNLETKKGISNLIDIYSSIKGITHKEVEKIISGSKYGEFKIEVGETVAEYIEPIFSKYQSLNEKEILSLLKANLDIAKSSAEETMKEVNGLLGI